jgi:hypothetical protein
MFASRARGESCAPLVQLKEFLAQKSRAATVARLYIIFLKILRLQG